MTDTDDPEDRPGNADTGADPPPNSARPKDASRPRSRPRSSPSSLRRSLYQLIGLAGGFLMVTSVFLLVGQIQLNDRRDDVINRVDRASVELRDLRATLIDQESGVRGFVITGRESFLAPYLNGQPGAIDSETRFRRLTDDTPAMADSLAELDRRVDTWRTEAAEVAIAGIRLGSALPGDEAFQTTAKARFDAVRAQLDVLDRELEDERQDALDRVRVTYRLILGVMAAQAAGLVVIGIIIVRGLNRLVILPIDELGEQVRDVAEGEVGKVVETSGPPEIAMLGEDIESMRRRIVAELERLHDANAAIQLQARDLERSNADLEQFAYVASHDLQEPLRKVAGFCQLLEKRYKGQLDERADEYIHFAVDGAKRMEFLINDLLSFSRVGRTTERFASIDLDAVVARALDNLATAINDSGAVVTVAGDLPVVRGDERLLTSLFQNLIGNAIKFRSQSAPVVTITSRADDDSDRWILQVADNGIGISSDYANDVFTLFKRLHTKSEYPGTGIGLALCKRIVEFHDGEIEILISDPTGDHLDPPATPDAVNATGTTIEFSLPRTKALIHEHA